MKINKENSKQILDFLNVTKVKIDNVFNLLAKYPKPEKWIEIENAEEFFKIISFLTPQSKSIWIETKIIEKLELKKIKANLNRGDAINKNNEYIEIKISTPSKFGNILNLVQIRPFQNLDYYFCVFVDDINFQNNFFFVLNKKEMDTEIKLIGTNAHISGNKNQHKEFRISIKIDLKDVNFQRWLKHYRNSEIERKIFGNENN
ncbi:hypothetical protein ACUZ9N_02535 [Mycoplasmopsis gallinarum]